MAKEYKKENITQTYFTIDILDDCWKITGDTYDEIGKKDCPQDLIGACKKVVEMIKNDKDYKDEPKWDYRVIKHEEDDDTDWQTAFKVYKYRGKWKYRKDCDY